MFSRATIRLGIGPHSSSVYFVLSVLFSEDTVKIFGVLLLFV